MQHATRIATLFLFAIIFVLSPSTLLSQTEVIAPDTRLQNATKLALKNDFAGALKIVQEVRAANGQDLHFAVRFVDSVVAMADMSDARHRVSFLNEAIKSANTLETSKFCDGTKDAEFAYHYMVAMGKLAESIVGTNDKIAGQIFAAEAKVASNLLKNPGFPAESKPVLADPIMSRAKSMAIKGDAKATVAAMKVAFDAGFTNYEELESDEIFQELKSDEVNKLIETSVDAYKTKLAKWARKSVDGFSAFKFKFNVADIDVGRVRESDFSGRVLVVDLWATWCAPCRDSIPHFIKLDEEFRDDNVEVLGISMDNPDDPRKSLSAVQDFVDDHDVEYLIAMGDRSVMNQLNPGQKLPTVLFIDATGKVRYIAEGPHNFFQLEAIVNEMLRRDTGMPTSLQVESNLAK